MLRRFTVAIMVLLAALAIASCGIKGALKLPPSKSGAPAAAAPPVVDPATVTAPEMTPPVLSPPPTSAPPPAAPPVAPAPVTAPGDRKP